MKERKDRRQYIFAFLFIISGLFLIILPFIEQSGYIMIIPGGISLISGGLILFQSNNIYTKILPLSSGIYNLTIFFFHAYSSIYLLGTSFSSFATISIIGYTSASFAFLFMVLILYADYSHY